MYIYIYVYIYIYIYIYIYLYIYIPIYCMGIDASTVCNSSNSLANQKAGPLEISTNIYGKEVEIKTGRKDRKTEINPHDLWPSVRFVTFLIWPAIIGLGGLVSRGDVYRPR